MSSWFIGVCEESAFPTDLQTLDPITLYDIIALRYGMFSSCSLCY